MKKIPNLSFAPKDAEPQTVAKLLSACLNTPPPQGFDFATMRIRNKIQDVLDSAENNQEIVLEDAQFSAAVEAVKMTRWRSREKHLIEFGELFGL
jgi:hypothetical protein